MVERIARAASIDTKRALGGGIAAGLVGGLMFWLVLMVLSAAQGGTIWAVMKGAAMPFIGEAAVRSEFAAGPVLFGTVLHAAISAAWGATFGVLAYGLSRVATVVAGVGWGLVVWLIMHYVVLPLVGLGGMVAQSNQVLAILVHLVFGVSTGLAFLPFQRRAPTTPVRRGVGRPVTP